MLKPIFAVKPTLRLFFSFEANFRSDFSDYVHRVDFKGIANGGYMFSAQLYDPALSFFDDLVKKSYFEAAMKSPQWVKFQLASYAEGQHPESATKQQYGIILSMRSIMDSGIPLLEMIAVDPITHALTMGDSSGGAYKGTIDKVITQVINDYGNVVDGKPPTIDVAKFAGSEDMAWHMHRQDPKSFITSLLEWSSGLTESKTQLLIGIDGNNLSIKEQAKMQEKRRGYYTKFGTAEDNILEHKIIANSFISAVQTKMTTNGASSANGFYIDHKADAAENFAVVSDRTTQNKYVPRISSEKGFSKAASYPGSTRPYAGSSAVSAIPELLSTGEFGVPYQNYIDGRARNQYYNLSNNGLQMLLTVFGHGEYSDTIGLGADTVFVELQNISKTYERSHFWSTGCWIVRGFHHRLTKSLWTTDLLLTRLEYDATGRKVGV
jgi:hypothetical protein